MKIKSLKAKNYRSLEDFHVDFSDVYTVISGKNNAGKSALFGAIESLVGFQRNEPFRVGPDRSEIAWAEDVTFWKKDQNPDICLEAILECSEIDDPSMFEFIKRISARNISGIVQLCLRRKVDCKDNEIFEVYFIGDDEVLDPVAIQEIKRALNDRAVFIMHDSTNQIRLGRLYGKSGADNFFNPSDADRQKIASLNKQFSNIVTKSSRIKKEMIEQILGELGEKYKVNIEIPKVQIENIPFDIALGEREGGAIRLDNWGSGTRNRTLILSLLIKARQLATLKDDSSKVAPVIFIEEPEAFLHPSAQSNFGRVIEDIAKESNIQIIVSSHSPFLLSRMNPTSNILLERRQKRKINFETEVLPTSGENWMAPFAESLGITKSELEPWRQVLNDETGCVVVVEGELDKEYIEFYNNHVGGVLKSELQIIPIGGKDKLSDVSMIRFVSKFSKRVVYVLDLDANNLEGRFLNAGLQRNDDFLFVGKDAPGKRKIEGLLPEQVRVAVHANNDDVVSMMQSDKVDEKKKGQSIIKRKYLDEFKRWCNEGNRSSDFDRLLKSIAQAVSAQSR